MPRKTQLRGYDRYVELYSRAQSSMAKKGEMMYSPMLSKLEYDTTATAIKNTAKEFGEKRVRDPAQTIVSDQRYKRNVSELKGFESLRERVGEKKLSVQEKKEFRQGKRGFSDAEYNQILNEYNDIKNGGKSSSQARRAIAVAYFGS